MSEEEKPPEPAPESVAAVAASVAGEEKPPEPESQKVKKGDRQARLVAEFRTEAEQAVRAEIDTVIQEAQLSSTRLYQNVKLMDRRSTETAVQQEPLVRLRTCGELATVGLLLSSGSGHNAVGPEPRFSPDRRNIFHDG